MQTLSIWPSNGDCWVPPPQLNHELGFSCISSTRRMRRKILGFNGPFCHSRSTSLLLVTTNSRGSRSGRSCCGSTKYDLGCRFFFGCSKIKILLFCDPDKGSLGVPVALACALEQQAIGNELGKDDSNSVNGEILGKSDSEDASFLVLNRVEDSNDNKNGEKKNVGIKSEEVGKERGSRIDVRALARSLHSAETADDIEEVLKGKSELPLQIYSSIIKGFGIDKRLNSAMILVEWLNRKKEENSGFVGPNLFIYNSLLGAVKQSGQYDQVEKVMNDMAHEGVVPNVVTYNTLMAIYLDQGRATEALNILDEIRQKGFSPSPVSYSTASLAYRKMEDGFGALKFFIELREKYKNGEIGKDGNGNWKNEFFKLEKLTIVVCFQVMRRWLVKGGNLSTNVLKLLKDMDVAGLQPEREEHERLVWACTDEGHYMVAKELYNRIRERHPEMSLSVCNHLIWLMGKAKKWWAALEIYEDLLDKGPKPNNLSYELILSHFNILLNAARKRGIWKWGVRLLNKMEEKGLKPGTREWNAVLVACSKASESSAAVEIFTRMVEQGQKPTIVSYGALLSALEKGKLYDEAFRVWEHMIKVGVEPNLYAYTIMASICVGQGKFNLVESVIRDMKASKIEPTVVTYNAIISACAKNGLGSVAYEWFHRMKVQDIPPNEITYEMLIQALAKDGKPRLAYELYLRARNEGLNLSSKAYDAVTQSSKDYGASIELSVLGPRPVEERKKVQIREKLSEISSLDDVPMREKPLDDSKEITSNLNL